MEEYLYTLCKLIIVLDIFYNLPSTKKCHKLKSPPNISLISPPYLKSPPNKRQVIKTAVIFVINFLHWNEVNQGPIPHCGSALKVRMKD